MDLIFTDGQLNDVGVLDCLKLDYDTAGSKDFELTLSSEDAKLEAGSMWYVVGEEYLGIVEAIKSNTESEEVTYSGTNTRGLLDKRIIENASIKTVSGSFKEITEQWLLDSGLGGLFVVENDMDISLYDVPAFSTVYDAIVGILDTENCTPLFEVTSNRKIKIIADAKRDLSDEIQYTGSGTYSLEIEKQYNAINHIILFNKNDDGNNRYIHLFTDANGGVQDYTDKDIPIEDSDYILDKRNQILFGVDERTKLLECSVDKVENYKLQDSEPEDWKRNFDAYYIQDIDEESGAVSYKVVEGVESTTFSLMKRKPDDWETGYSNYYTHSGSTMSPSDFSQVSANTTVKYKLIDKKPADWSKNWGVYFERYSDGTGYVYRAATGIDYNSYKKMTQQPTGWNSNYKNYYKRGTVYKINTERYRKTPPWKRGTYYKKTGDRYTLVKTKPKNWNKTDWKTLYTKNGIGYVKITGNKAPKFKKNKYYIQEAKSKAPAWSSKKYYYKFTEITNPPKWTTATYWSKFTFESAPVWSGGMYFTKVLDNYAAMIEEGIKELSSFSPSQKAEIELVDYEARIGDVVGCTDTKNSLMINEEVTNVIFKISGGSETYEYTIGGN